MNEKYLINLLEILLPSESDRTSLHLKEALSKVPHEVDGSAIYFNRDKLEPIPDISDGIISEVVYFFEGKKEISLMLLIKDSIPYEITVTENTAVLTSLPEIPPTRYTSIERFGFAKK